MSKFVDAEKLRTELFDESIRPTAITIRRWAKRRIIPSHKINGYHVVFILEEVRDHLMRRNKIKAKA